MRLSRALAVVLALASSACALSHELPPPGGRADAGSSSCGAPAVATYDCAPIATGSAGCSGTPYAYATLTSVPNPSAEYPDGCEVTLAICHPFYPSEVAACTCTTTTGTTGTFAWSCPL